MHPAASPSAPCGGDERDHAVRRLEGHAGRLLLVLSDDDAGDALVRLAHGAGLATELARGFSDLSSTAFDRIPDAVLMDCRPAAELTSFLLRVRDRWGAKLPRLVLAGTLDELDVEAVGIAVDAMVVGPAAAGLLAEVLGIDAQPPAAGAPLQLLARLSCLSGARDEALRQVADGVVAAFAVSAASLSSGRDDLISTHAPFGAGGEDDRRALASAAARLGATLVASTAAWGGRDEAVFSCVAAALGDQDDCDDVIALFAEGARVFGHDERDLLRGFAGRIGAELSWRSSLARALRDADAMREEPRLNATLDLWNEAAFSRLALRELSRRDLEDHPLAVMVLDVAGMRDINARHGHSAGDQALRRVADVVRLAVRQADLVGLRSRRIAVLFADADADRATRVLHRIRMMLDTEPLRLRSGHELKIRVRAGVAVSHGEEQPDVLLSRASNAAAEARKFDTPVVVADVDPTPGVASTALAESSPNIADAITLGGNYRLLHEISSGGMGVVYRAEDLALSRPVAIKMLRPDLASDEALVARFRTEAGILAQLHHRGLVQIYAFGVDGDDTYFAMELVEGESLEDRIERCKRRGEHISPADVVTIMTQIADALDAIHAVGIVHRDIKPANVLIDPFHNRAVLVDVGIARRYGEESAAAGTPGFVAPEVMLGAEASQRADVYALAVTTYELLALRSPWGDASTVQEVIDRQCWQGPQPMGEIVAELAPLDALFERTFSPEPMDRPASASAFAEALADALATINRSSRDASPSVDAFSLADTAPPGDRYPWPEQDLSQPSSAVGRGRPNAGTTVPAFDRRTTHCRGVVFRSVPQVLGARQADRWRRQLMLERPEIGRVLGSETAPLSWLRAGLFVELLSSPPQGMTAAEFGLALGRAAIRTSFRRFFPVSAATLVPGRTLAALDVIWCRYHTWGQPKAMVMAGEQAAVTLTGMPKAPAVRSFVAGMLEQLATMSRGTEVTCRQVEWDAATGTCTFELSWQLEPA